MGFPEVLVSLQDTEAKPQSPLKKAGVNEKWRMSSCVARNTTQRESIL